MTRKIDIPIEGQALTLTIDLRKVGYVATRATVTAILNERKVTRYLIPLASQNGVTGL